MISRLTTYAVTFAALAGASIALAATVSTASVDTVVARTGVTAEAKPVRIVELPRVVVVARRLPG